MTRPLPLRVILLAAAVLAATSGCVPWQRSDRHSVMWIWLVDMSGSYGALGRTVTDITAVLDSLRPGDRLIVRSIGATSHTASNQLLDYVPFRVPSNRLDPQARSARDSAGAHRDAAARALESLRTAPRTGRTDIVGAFAAVTEMAAQRSAGQQVVIALASDLDDNGPNRSVTLPINLTGVHVRFVNVESARLPLATLLSLKEEWRARVLAWGAATADVIPTGHSVQPPRDQEAE